MMARRVVAVAFIVGLLSVQAASTALRTGPVAGPRASPEPGTDTTIGGLVAARPLSRLLEAVLPDRALRSDAPLQSWILGGSRTPPQLIEDYRALVAASPHPFADAVDRWSDFLGAREDPILETRALERAGHWPRAAQESVALLLYAITDASYQQRIALDALTADEVGRLVRDLPDLARGTPEALAQEPAQQALELVARIDMAPIYAGSSLLVRAIDEALPALEAWSHAARLQRDDAAQLQGLVDLARRGPHGDPFEDVLVTLQTAGRVLDLVEASAPVAHALSPRGFVERLKATRFDAGSSWAAVDGLDDLPPDLRRALLHLLSRYAAYAGAADEPMSAQFAHVLALVESVRDAAPVIEKWSLIFQHLGPGLPKTRQQNLVEFLQLLSLASRPDAPPSDLIRLTATLGGNPRPPGPAPAPPAEAELATEVVRLYHRHGLAPQAADLHALELGALNLPDQVRTAAALLVRALNDGEEHVVAAERSVADAHADFFAMDGPRRAARAFASEAPSASDMAALREQFQILEELQAASLQAAITISDAANHAHAILAYQDDFAAQSGNMRVEGVGWWDRLSAALQTAALWYFEHLTPLGLLPSASAQAPAPSCPVSSPLSDCGFDIWFQDPLLKWIIISGFGTTVYDPQIIRGGLSLNVVGAKVTLDQRGQMLTLDLGGNDVYRNNAGGVLAPKARFPFSAGSGGDSGLDTFRVALALDLGGDDRYDVPPPPFPDAGIQGAGVGGVGILWDASGSDSYTAAAEGQGYGEGSSVDLDTGTGDHAILVPGIGLLVDADGSDTYVAQDRAQGTGAGLALQSVLLSGPRLASTFGTGPGLGVLFDRNGDDIYRILREDAIALGAAQRGIGLLVDAGGNDRYQGGRQGNVDAGGSVTLGLINVGLGILADLGGADEYTRTKPPGAQTMRDGDCWTSVSAPNRDPVQGARVSTSTPVPFADHTLSIARSQLGVFIDLPSDQPPCRFDAEPLKPPLLTLAPTPTPPDPETLTPDDPDGDGWPTAFEVLLGTDPQNAADHPAGWPTRPAAWPDAVPYPPDGGQALPPSPGPLVHVPGLLLIGDVIDNHYPEGRDYPVLLDLGGSDTYRNRVGGGSGLLPGLPVLAVDFGNASDTYDTPADALGSNGILIDLGGDDTYRSPERSQGYASPVDPRRLALGLLIDLSGDDRYEASASSQGVVEDALGPSYLVAQHMALGALLDVDGDDTYASPTQGYARGGGMLPSQGLALFADLNGTDRYEPADQQGVIADTPEVLDAAPVAQSLLAAFMDLNGWDAYLVPNSRGGSLDASATRNQHAVTVLRAGGSARDFSQSGVTVSTVGGASLYLDTNATVAPRSDLRCPLLEDEAPSGSPPCGVEGGNVLVLPALGIAIADGAHDDTHVDDYAFLVDLGGDDTYANNAGGSLFRILGAPRLQHGPGTCGAVPMVTIGGEMVCTDRRPLVLEAPMDLRPSPIAALHLDLSGDDTYAGSEHVASGRSHIVAMDGSPIDAASPRLFQPRRGVVVQGAGFLATGILVDAQGNDRYEARAHAQGSGLAGVGLLWDRDGHDTYGFNDEVIRRPVFAHGGIASEQLVKDRWSIHPLPPQSGESVSLDGEDDLAVFQNDARGDWDVYAATPDEVLLLAAGPGDQERPRTDGRLIAWQDNAAGTWDVYLATRDTSARLLTPNTMDSNQRNPDVANPWVVWQDDRDGTWDIRGWDLVRNEGFAIAADSSMDETEPRIVDGWVTWKEVSRSGDRLPVFRLHDLRSGATHTIATSAQLQGAPVAGPGYALYVESSDHGDVLWHYDPATGKRNPLVGAFNVACAQGQPVSIQDVSVDTAHPGRAALVLRRTAPSAEHPAGSVLPFIRVLAFDSADGSLTPASPDCGLTYLDPNEDLGISEQPDQSGAFLPPTPTDLSALPGTGPAFLQGAAAQLGRGILLDEGGSDRYAAYGYSQGASRTILGPTFAPVNAGVAAPGARPELDHALVVGLLADLHGNDAYTAHRFSQGVQEMVTTYQSITDAQSELQSSSGMLLDLHGRDEYRANRFAQGWSGLRLGHWSLDLPSDGQVGTPPVPHGRTYVDLSMGVFADFGGDDLYAYGEEDQVLSRVWRDGEDPSRPLRVDPRLSLDSSSLEIPVPFPVPTCDELVLGPQECAVADPLLVALGADRNGRNNLVWTQRGDPADLTQLSVPPEQSPDRPQRFCVQSARIDKCPPILVLGGVGVDRDVTDQVVRSLHAALPRFFDVEIQSPTLTRRGTLEGTAILEAVVQPADGVPPESTAALDAKHVEFFFSPSGSDQAPVRLGPALPLPALGCRFCFVWETQKAGVPDGRYLIEAVVTFGSAATGVPLGYAEASRVLGVDNPPRLVAAPAQGRVFSPHPFADDVPQAFEWTVDVSPDLDGAPTTVKLHVIDATGKEVAVVNALPSPPDAPRTLHWDGSTPQGLAPDGAYLVRLEARDRAAHVSRLFESVLLDATPPAFTCIRLQADDHCNPGSRTDPAGVNTRNAATERINDALHLVVPLTLDSSPEDATGIRWHHLYARSIVAGSPGPWALVAQTAQHTANLQVPHGATVEAVVLSEDRVGNLECASTCHTDRSPPVLGLLDALQLKQEGLFTAEGAFVAGSAVLGGDAVPPVLVSARINDVLLQDLGLPRFGAQGGFLLTGRGEEADSGPLQARLTLISIEDPLDSSAEVIIPAALLSAPGAYEFSWDDWAKTVAAWPEGIIAYTLFVQDRLGNPSPEQRGQLVLDRTPPEVVESSIIVDYPDGQLHATAGQVVGVRLQMADPTIGLFALPPEALRATLDASAVRFTPVALSLGCADGTFPPAAVPFCFDGFDSFRTSFAVEPVPGMGPGDSARLLLDLTVDDGLGNAQTLPGAVAVVVGDPEFGIHDAVVEPEAQAVRVEWRTHKPSQGALRMAPAGGAFGSELAAESSDGLHHVARVAGLLPATAYQVQILARDPATGVTELQTPVPFRTSHGLTTAFTHPAEDQPVRGDLTVRWTTQVAPGPTRTVRYELQLVPITSASPPKQLNVFEGPAGAQEFTLLTSGLPDGAYRLRLTTTIGDEVLTVDSGTIVVDNQPPTVAIVAPAPGTALPPDAVRIRLSLRDATSGINCDEIQLHVNNRTLPPSECGPVAVFDPRAHLVEGVNLVLALIADAAGNVRRVEWAFVADSDLPALSHARILYSDGHGAARSGEAVQVEATATSDSGIRSVELRAPALGVDGPIGFSPAADGAWSASFTVVHDVPDGASSLELLATDRVGRVGRLLVEVVVDNQAPNLDSVRLLPSLDGARHLLIEASEPVDLRLRLNRVDGASRLVAASWSDLTDPATEPVRRLAGSASPAVGVLRFHAGELIGVASIQVVANDRAGHEAHRTLEVSGLDAAGVAPGPERLSASRDLEGRIVLDWSSPVFSSDSLFHVYRAVAPSEPFERRATVTGTRWMDPETSRVGELWYYVTRVGVGGAESLPSPVQRIQSFEAPLVRAQDVRPAAGSPRTPFRFEVEFVDPAGREALDAWLVINEVPHRMLAIGTEDCAQGCTYGVEIRLAPTTLRDAGNRFHYEIDWGAEHLRFPVVGELDGPVVVDAVDFADGSPAPAAPAVGVALVLLLPFVAWLRRRSR